MKGRIPKGKILIKAIPQETETASGIILTEESDQKTAKVVIGGDEVQDGTVYYNVKKTFPIKVVIEDEEYFILREKDVLYNE